MKANPTKQEFYISLVLQTELGIYLPSETVIRKPFNVTFDEDMGEWNGLIRIQGRYLSVTSDCRDHSYQVCSTHKEVN